MGLSSANVFQVFRVFISSLAVLKEINMIKDVHVFAFGAYNTE